MYAFDCYIAALLQRDDHRIHTEDIRAQARHHVCIPRDNPIQTLPLLLKMDQCRFLKTTSVEIAEVLLTHTLRGISRAHDTVYCVC